MSRPVFCPSGDHDGHAFPVERHLDAVDQVTGRPHVETARCAYCAEGYLAQMVRLGFRVTIWAVAVPCGAWNDGHDCHQPAGHPGDHLCAGCGDVWNRGPWDDDADEWEHERPDVEERCVHAL